MKYCLQLGGYLSQQKIDEIISNPDTIIQLATQLKAERQEKAMLEQQVAEYEPKVTYLDMILGSQDLVTISQISGDYGMSAIEVPKADGTKRVVMDTRWTQKGRLFIYDLLKENGIYPEIDLVEQEV